MEKNTTQHSHQFLLQNEDQQWQSISLRYVRVLQVRLLVSMLLLLIVTTVLLHTIISLQYIIMITSCIVVAIAVIATVVLPRKVRLTRYLVGELDVNLQKGFLFRQHISLAINRIQHLEVTQSPVERLLKLSRIAIYTAGGYQSDLVIPGVETSTAMQIKQRLLNQISFEEL